MKTLVLGSLPPHGQSRPDCATPQPSTGLARPRFWHPSSAGGQDPAGAGTRVASLRAQLVPVGSVGTAARAVEGESEAGESRHLPWLRLPGQRAQRSIHKMRLYKWGSLAGGQQERTLLKGALSVACCFSLQAAKRDGRLSLPNFLHLSFEPG